MEEISLPSGAVLKIGKVPFVDAMALNEAVAEELKSVPFQMNRDMGELLKDLLCAGISSQKIKAALWKCMGRCIYRSPVGDLKIDKDTFEPDENRQDYFEVCTEVAKAVMLPFAKAHSQKFFQVLESLKSSPESKPQTTHS